MQDIAELLGTDYGRVMSVATRLASLKRGNQLKAAAGLPAAHARRAYKNFPSLFVVKVAHD